MNVGISIAKIACLILYASLASLTVNAATLDRDGEYRIILAVHPSTPEPVEYIANYFKEISDTLEIFSGQLFGATSGTFFLKRVEVLVPGHWTFSVPESVSESLEVADIRLTASLTSTPRVENLHPCGLAGDYVELPSGFFNTTLPQRLGHPSKALLNLWARFRWGVYEEHGVPGSKVVPYFYKNYTIDADNWEVTGCSNVKLDGALASVDGTPCENIDGAEPPEGCRFRPHQSNIATTSLMGFHWLPSVTQFCNATNHNKGAPNRQNIFCDYQSVWSVIQSTNGFASVTQKVIEVPPVEFNIIKQRQQPNLYILIDSGSFIDNDESGLIFAEIIKGLLPFLSQDGLRGTLVSVGSYPSGEEDGKPTLKQQVDWLPLGGADNLDVISKAIFAVPTNTTYSRDFGQALQEVANKVEELNPAFQTALVVLKAGAAINSWCSGYIEEEILSSLRSNRIALSAFELEMENPTANYPRNLETLAQRSGGVHVPLKTCDQVEPSLLILLQNVTTFLQSREPTQSHEHVDHLDPNTEISIPFSPGMEKELKVHLAVPTNSPPPKLTWTGGAGTQKSRFEWAQNGIIGQPGRFVISVEPTLETENPITEFKVQYTCPDCYRFFIDKLLITCASNPLVPIDDGIVTSVSISSPTNLVDLSQHRRTDLAPFVIHAKIHKNGVPVKNLDVKARLYFTGCCLETDRITLRDDGFVSPDVALHDGIYSGTYIPRRNSTYRIAVTIQYKKATKMVTRQPLLSTLLPEDQIITPQPEAVELDHSFSKSIDYSHEVTFKNVPWGYYALMGKPYKIIDLVAQYNNTGPEERSPIKLTFKTPGIILDRDNPYYERVTRYLVLGAESAEDMVSGNRVRVALNVSATKYYVGDEEVLFMYVYTGSIRQVSSYPSSASHNRLGNVQYRPSITS